MFTNPFKNIKNIFGFLLATVLLGFYVGTWGVMLIDALTDGKMHLTPISEGFFYIATTVSGIASALAVTVLGVTPPNVAPSFSYFNSAARAAAKVKAEVKSQSLTPEGIMDATPEEQKDWLTLLYLCSWVIIGVGAVLLGTMTEAKPAENMEKVIEHLSNYGTIWFGMAMSAVFVYMKVDPV